MINDAERLQFLIDNSAIIKWGGKSTSEGMNTGCWVHYVHDESDQIGIFDSERSAIDAAIKGSQS